MIASLLLFFSSSIGEAIHISANSDDFLTVSYFIISFALAHKLYAMAYLYVGSAIAKVIILRLNLVAGANLYEIVFVKLATQLILLILYLSIMTYIFLISRNLEQGNFYDQH